jgi:polyhydroxyalkanoate synthesis repressor PhaR
MSTTAPDICSSPRFTACARSRISRRAAAPRRLPFASAKIPVPGTENLLILTGHKLIATGAPDMTNSVSPITIKKYANRRLYNTASSAYVTLADLAKMVKSGEDFVVYDAKTNEDITRSVLTQIIFEQEGVEGQSLLPIAFLRQVIRFYGDSVQALLPSYLEYSIERFSGEQQKMRETMSRALDPNGYSTASFNALQELTRQNLAAFNKALSMFSPFPGAAAPPAETAKDSSSEISELREELSQMKRRLDEISPKS